MRVVIVGAGQGGFQVAASLREQGFAGEIVLVGDEPGLPYQRPPLSKAYLMGEMGADRLLLRQAPFYEKNRITLRVGTRVSAIDRARRVVRLAGGGEEPYDHLVLATGSRDRPLPVEGAELEGVMRLRTRAEADFLAGRLETVRRAVVVGAGFIGLEFAAVARKRGLEVTVIEMAGRPMARAVSPAISAHFQAVHVENGVEILFGAALRRIQGEEGRVRGVETADGRRLPADLVLLGIGIVPNAELAAEAGLTVENGIVVDEALLTSDPAISAIGDCAAYPSPFADGAMVRLESVQNAVDQGRCVAARLVGKPAPYRAVPWFWSDQGDLRLQIAGLTTGQDRAVLRGDPASGRCSVFCFRAGRLVGVESVNQPGEHMLARRLLAGEALLTPEEAADPAFDLKSRAAPRRREDAPQAAESPA